MTLIDEIPEIRIIANEDDFDSGDLEPIDIDRMCDVLAFFEPGDAAILDLFVAFLSKFKQAGHLTDTSPITTKQGRECLERLHKAAVLMEVRA